MRIPIFATLCMVLAVIVLAGLGTWQVKRLAWKTEIINELEKARKTDPRDNELTLPELQHYHGEEYRYIRGYITGKYEHHKEIAVRPRTYKGISGYHIVTPFILADGGTILINRGWVSEDKLAQNDRPHSLTPGIVKVFGMARLPEKPNRFVPENKPNAGEWYSIQPELIARYQGLQKLAPYIFYAENFNAGTARFPIPQDTEWMPNNNHLAYAIFWFTMIPVLIVIYYLRFIAAPKKKKSPKKKTS